MTGECLSLMMLFIVWQERNKNRKMKENVFFVSGIDTNVGKSYATGHIARMWMDEGYTVITQKLVQTGNHDVSEDIELHRKIMGMGFTADDVSKTTMPEIFSYPCSPHLAAKIDGRDIDFAHIERCTRLLSDKYDRVLLEGAGGLMVPLTEDLFTIDYIKRHDYKLIFVTSGKLGSINHTVLSLEAVKKRGIRVAMIAYNLHCDEKDSIIYDDTFDFIKKFVKQEFPEAELTVIPEITL